MRLEYFQMLDSIDHLDREAMHLKATSTVPATSPVFEGHFPGQPIMPAVLMVEAMAQLAGVAAQSDPTIPALPGLRLTAIRGVKVFGTAVPGETLTLCVEVQGRMGSLIQATGKVSVGERVIAEGQITLSGS